MKVVTCTHDAGRDTATWSHLELIWFTDAGGRRHLRYTCDVCGKRSEAIPHRNVAAREVVSPRRTYPPCVVKRCGADGVHQHHIAPYSVFGSEADWWPLIDVCQRHHEEWHARMNGYDRHRSYQEPEDDITFDPTMPWTD